MSTDDLSRPMAARRFLRACLDAVRCADQPLTTREVTKAAMRQLGPGTRDEALVARLAVRAERHLRRKAPLLVVRIFFGPRAAGWIASG